MRSCELRGAGQELSATPRLKSNKSDRFWRVKKYFNLSQRRRRKIFLIKLSEASRVVFPVARSEFFNLNLGDSSCWASQPFCRSVNVLNLMSIVKYDIHRTYQLTSAGINHKKENQTNVRKEGRAERRE
jgi:hypothetical protein